MDIGDLGCDNIKPHFLNIGNLEISNKRLKFEIGLWCWLIGVRDAILIENSISIVADEGIFKSWRV